MHAVPYLAITNVFNALVNKLNACAGILIAETAQ